MRNSTESDEVRNLGNLSSQKDDVLLRHLQEGVMQEAIQVRLVRVKVDEESKKAVSRRKHNLKGSLRTLHQALEAIKSGYRFDDDRATIKIAAMEKALSVLESESTIVFDILAQD